ncbi:hypothetical protein HKCCE2091_14450 [Rhodobacterales bacterium HKCCE2091]|nr:hypothetical protein [Rhodobacterales bacterium HKCCE2091]
MTSEITMNRPEGAKKPRIALLGEFSAGKSTLVNALMEQSRSPVRVTATHVPPIWYTFGEGMPVRVGRDGEETELDSQDLAGVPLRGTTHVRVPLQAEILRSCDLIDMPGSSDPNMERDIWDTLLPQADGVIWCSPATQAWRQSEAAIWEEVPQALYDRSLLLLTRIDKIRGGEDRMRLMARVRRETQGLFRAVFPVSLLDALGAQHDPDLWRQSGMAEFSEAFLEILHEAESGSRRPARAPEAAYTPREPALAGADVQPIRAAAPSGGAGIVPRRIVPRAGGRSARPRRAGGEGSLI